MNIVALTMAMLASAPNSMADEAVTLRSTIAPYLRCSQKFDADWIRLKVKSDRADDIAEAGDEKQRMDFSWEANQDARDARSKLRDFSDKIEDSCERPKFERLLKLEVAKLRPAYQPIDISTFARGLFDTFVGVDRDVAYFKAGHAAVPLIIMSPPAPSGSK